MVFLFRLNFLLKINDRKNHIKIANLNNEEIQILKNASYLIKLSIFKVEILNQKFIYKLLKKHVVCYFFNNTKKCIFT